MYRNKKTIGQLLILSPKQQNQLLFNNDFAVYVINNVV